MRSSVKGIYMPTADGDSNDEIFERAEEVERDGESVSASIDDGDDESDESDDERDDEIMSNSVVNNNFNILFTSGVSQEMPGHLTTR
jgi:hypothetical protein